LATLKITFLCYGKCFSFISFISSVIVVIFNDHIVQFIKIKQLIFEDCFTLIFTLVLYLFFF